MDSSSCRSLGNGHYSGIFGLSWLYGFYFLSESFRYTTSKAYWLSGYSWVCAKEACFRAWYKPFVAQSQPFRLTCILQVLYLSTIYKRHELQLRYFFRPITYWISEVDSFATDRVGIFYASGIFLSSSILRCPVLTPHLLASLSGAFGG